MMRWLFFFFLLAAIALGATDDYEVSVTSVSIWVKVVDASGQPVKGLTQADFQVFDDNKPVQPTCFEESKFEVGPSGIPVNVPAQSPRKFVIFLDLYNTTDTELKMVRPALQDFVHKLSGTNSEVMVAALLSSGKLGVVVPFTRDLERITKLIDQAKGNFTRDQQMRNNDKELEELLAMAKPKARERTADRGDDSSTAGGEVALSANPDTQIRDVAIKNAYRLAQNYYVEDKRDTEYSLAVMDSFTQDLSRRRLEPDEHAAVLWISGGFNFNPGRHYFEKVEELDNKESSPNDVVKFAIQNPGSRRQASQDTQRNIKKSIGKMNRANVTVYAINTRGMFVPGTNASIQSMDLAFQDPALLQDFQDSLIEIANETGGLSFANSQNFPVGFANILQDLAHQYVLCFSPSGKKKEEQYHQIKVVCKRPGVKVRHRLGYYR